MSVQAERRPARRPLAEMTVAIIEAVAIALIIRTFAFQPFYIPSGSMEPTLLVGDYLFVAKFSYGFSRYSLPFSPPLFSGRFFASLPRRGDVVVFRHRTEDFIKRIIGLPGDHIQVTGGTLIINGRPVERHQIGDFVGHDPCRPAPADSPPVRVAQWQERLPNGVAYDSLECAGGLAPQDNTGVYIVPPGHYFVMGDNRENSEDSRFPDVGYVPFDHLIGRAELIFFSIGNGAAPWEIWRWPGSLRWSRLFTIIR